MCYSGSDAVVSFCRCVRPCQVTCVMLCAFKCYFACPVLFGDVCLVLFQIPCPVKFPAPVVTCPSLMCCTCVSSCTPCWMWAVFAFPSLEHHLSLSLLIPSLWYLLWLTTCVANWVCLKWLTFALVSVPALWVSFRLCAWHWGPAQCLVQYLFGCTSTAKGYQHWIIWSKQNQNDQINAVNEKTLSSKK